MALLVGIPFLRLSFSVVTRDNSRKRKKLFSCRLHNSSAKNIQQHNMPSQILSSQNGWFAEAIVFISFLKDMFVSSLSYIQK